MRSRILLVLPALMLPLSAVGSPHWEYTGEHGPAHWGALAEAYAACNGRNQSPVDLGGAIDATLPALHINYSGMATSVIDNGHTLQVDADGAGSLKLDGQGFTLRQFHFHAPSEHQIDGRRFPLEVHLVHSDDSGQLAVIGVLFEAGAAHPLLSALAAQLPATTGTAEALSTPLAPAALLPASTDYLRYNGSLTTPPCSEGVRWIVLEQPTSASSEQIEAIAEAMHHANNRPLQPLNARMVLD